MHSSNDGRWVAGIGIGAVLSGALLIVLLAGSSLGPSSVSVPDPASANRDAGPSFGAPPPQITLSRCARSPDGRQPQRDPFYRVANTLEADGLQLADPAGLAYLPASRILAALSGEDDAAKYEKLTLFGDRGGTVRVEDGGGDVMSVLSGRPDRSTLAGLNNETPHLTLLTLDKEGRVNTDQMARYVDLRGFGLSRVAALAVRAGSNEISLLDPANARVVELTLALPAAEEASARVVRACEIRSSRLRATFALAVRRGDGHYFALANAREGRLVLHELDEYGRAVSRYDLSEADLTAPLAMVFAPSADPTDDARTEHLYVLDLVTRSLPSVVAISFDPVPEPPQRPVITPSVVRVIRTSAWSPPSADPTGITWDDNRGELVVTDSEIDELPLFEDSDVWFASLRGRVLRAGAVRRSVEPTDVAVDASTGTFFVSDDSRKVIYSIDPAEDGLLGTRDDAITELSTAMFGSFDPEGLAFGQGSLFIADGVASEVYRLTPGANGAFDGVAPRGDDEVFSFDVASAGLSDPEGLVFDPVQATLYVIDRTRRGPVAELTTDGELIRTIDLETLNLIAPAGIAIAPSSEDRRSRSLYLVDRGVDNARDPNENDGRLFEIRIDGL